MFVALDAREWAAAAAFVDADDVDDWLAGYLDVTDEPQRDVTKADMKVVNPDKPDAVAEYEAAEVNRRRRETRGALHGEFVGLDTRQQLAELTPQEALARYLHARDPEWQFAEQVSRLDPRVAPLVRDHIPVQRRSTIGAVLETPDTAHVVYAVRWSGATAESEYSETHVATLRHTPSGWRVRLRGELFFGGWSALVVAAPENESNEASE